MVFNSAFKGLKLFKKTGNGRLNNLNDPVRNVLKRVKEVSVLQYSNWQHLHTQCCFSFILSQVLNW